MTVRHSRVLSTGKTALCLLPFCFFSVVCPPALAWEQTGATLGARLDEAMQNLLKSYNVPGGALAVGYKGKLVFARGYGFADVEKRIPYKSTTITCLASVTKTVTALALLKLAEEGKLSLDQTLYESLGKPPLPDVSQDAPVKKITIRQLLHHSGGWRRGIFYDWKMLQNMSGGRPVDLEKFLVQVMRRPLDYEPGSEAHYSNFQYGVLNLVVEHASGTTYENYVQSHILHPLGITDMRREAIHGNYVEGEARRYDSRRQKVLPGGRPDYPLSGPMGSWIASAEDLVRLLTAIDGTKKPAILNQDSITEMFAAPAPPMTPRPNGTYFGIGWDVVTPAANLSQRQYSKNGGVAGIHSLIEHRAGDIDVALLFNGNGYLDTSEDADPNVESNANSNLNTNSNTTAKLFGKARKTINLILDNNSDWPQTDLFEQVQTRMPTPDP